MSDYILYTDSSADLTPEMVAQTGVKLLPLVYTVGGVSAQNDVNDPAIVRPFYAKLRAGEMSKTSAVNSSVFEDAFRADLAAGYDILYLGFSSGLSATVDAGKKAAENLAAEFPDRRVVVVDTLCASLGQGLLVYLSAMKKNEGASLDEVAAFAEENKLHLCHWFTVDDLHFLKRGGRVSAATAVVGSMLNIKPVLHVDNDGHLINVAKARGRAASIRALAERMRKTATPDLSRQTIFISHGDCEEDAQTLAGMAREMGASDVRIGYVGPVIGSHSGPGTLALFFLGQER